MQHTLIRLLTLCLAFLVQILCCSALKIETPAQHRSEPSPVTCHKKSLDRKIIIVFHVEESKKDGMPFEFECFARGKLQCNDIPESKAVREACEKCCRSFSKPSTNTSSFKKSSETISRIRTSPPTNVSSLARSNGIVPANQATTDKDGSNKLTQTLTISGVIAGAVIIVAFSGYCIKHKCKKKEESNADGMINPSLPVQVAEYKKQEETPLVKHYAGLVSTV